MTMPSQGGAPQPGSLTPAPIPLVVPVPDVRPQGPQLFDYSVNLNSDVFGAQLFTGAFARQAATQFNTDYVIAIGDSLQIRFWGAFNLDAL